MRVRRVALVAAALAFVAPVSAGVSTRSPCGDSIWLKAPASGTARGTA